MTDNERLPPRAFDDSELPPIVNTEKINFPSDSLTIGTLRRTHIEEFDGGLGSGFFRSKERWAADATIGALIFLERFLATDAFEAALGLRRTIDMDKDDRQLHVIELAALYVHYGLAKGDGAARELIRGIERQAVEQARQASRSR
jgi:hypothetical protein